MEQQESSAESFIKNLLVDFLIAVILAGVILYFYRPTIVRQTSMEDTLHENDYIIMSQRAYSKKDPQRGDIIIFQSSLPNESTGKDKLLIKRIIGLPGDTIAIYNDMLYLNGEYFEEDYLKDGFTPAREIPRNGESFTVPEGQYFAMGDNRVVSVDSRYSEVGCVAREEIKGKAVLRLLPLNKICKF